MIAIIAAVTGLVTAVGSLIAVITHQNDPNAHKPKP